MIYDYKEAKISFKKSKNSNYEMFLPTDKYDVADTTLGESGDYMFNNNDPFIVSKSDRCIVLKFSWGDFIEKQEKSEENEREEAEVQKEEDIKKEIDVLDELKEEKQKKNNKERIIKILPDSETINDYGDETNFVVLKFIATGEFFRLENQFISYEYEIKISNIEKEKEKENE